MDLCRAAPLLTLLLLAACQEAAPPAPAPKPAPAPAAPAKMVTMVCRNSQTGASVECGTPNAVMVGTKDN